MQKNVLNSDLDLKNLMKMKELEQKFQLHSKVNCTLFNSDLDLKTEMKEIEQKFQLHSNIN